MSFFQTIYQALNGFDANIIVAKNHDLEDGMLTISILPKPSGDQKIPFPPFVVTETPAYLDQHVEELFTNPVEAQGDYLKKSKEYADKVKSTEVAKQATKNTPSSDPKPKVKVLTAEEKKKEEEKKKFNSLYKEGQKAKEKKNYLAAKAFLQGALKLNPDDTAAKNMLAEVEKLLAVPVDMFATPIESIDTDKIMNEILTPEKEESVSEPPYEPSEPEFVDDDEYNDDDNDEPEFNDNELDPNA